MIERKNNGGEIQGFPNGEPPKTGPVEGTPAMVAPYMTSGDMTKSGYSDGFGQRKPLEMYQNDGVISEDEQKYINDNVARYDQIMQNKTDMYKKLYSEDQYYKKLHKALEDNGGDWNSDARDAYYEIWNSRRQRNPAWENENPLVYPDKESKRNHLRERIPWDVTMPWYRRLQYGAEKTAKMAEEGLKYLQDLPYEWASTLGKKITGTTIPPEALRQIHDTTAPGQRMIQDIGPDAIHSFKDIVRDDGSTEQFIDAVKDTPFSNLDFDRLDTYTPSGLRTQLGDKVWDQLTDAGAELGWDALNVGAVLGGILRGPAAVKGLSAALETGSKKAIIEVLKKAVKVKLPKSMDVLKTLAAVDRTQWMAALAATGTQAGKFIWDAYNEYGADAKAALIGTTHDILENSDFVKNQLKMDFSEEFIDKIMTEIPGVKLRNDYANLDEFLKDNNLEATNAQKLFAPESYDIQQGYLQKAEKAQREWEIERRREDQKNMTADQIKKQEDAFDQYLEEELSYDNTSTDIDELPKDVTNLSEDEKEGAVVAEFKSILNDGQEKEGGDTGSKKKKTPTREGSAGYKTLQRYLNNRK